MDVTTFHLVRLPVTSFTQRRMKDYHQIYHLTGDQIVWERKSITTLNTANMAPSKKSVSQRPTGGGTLLQHLASMPARDGMVRWTWDSTYCQSQSPFIKSVTTGLNIASSRWTPCRNDPTVVSDNDCVVQSNCMLIFFHFDFLLLFIVLIICLTRVSFLASTEVRRQHELPYQVGHEVWKGQSWIQGSSQVYA
jgi:hypothetical protein